MFFSDFIVCILLFFDDKSDSLWRRPCGPHYSYNILYCLVAIKTLMVFTRASKANQTTSTLGLTVSKFLTLETPCRVGDKGVNPYPVRPNIDTVWHRS